MKVVVKSPQRAEEVLWDELLAFPVRDLEEDLDGCWEIVDYPTDWFVGDANVNKVKGSMKGKNGFTKIEEERLLKIELKKKDIGSGIIHWWNRLLANDPNHIPLPNQPSPLSSNSNQHSSTHPNNSNNHSNACKLEKFN